MSVTISTEIESYGRTRAILVATVPDAPAANPGGMNWPAVRRFLGPALQHGSEVRGDDGYITAFAVQTPSGIQTVENGDVLYREADDPGAWVRVTSEADFNAQYAS